MFGSSCIGGVVEYQCHGNELWFCDYRCDLETFEKHCSNFPHDNIAVQSTKCEQCENWNVANGHHQVACHWCKRYQADLFKLRK